MSDMDFMPHGMCYLWQPGILSLHIVSDLLITAAYFSIPFTLVYFTRRRTDLRFSSMFLCFAMFIVACGTSHLMDIVTIWYPVYWISGGVKAITALASVPTAILLVKLVPVALRMPSPAMLEARVTERTSQLRTANQLLVEEARHRELLLQEIHHRVKNNLQVISSLINMQVRTLGDPPTREALRQCQARIETMAEIHEMLYEARDYGRIPFARYVRELTQRVLRSSGMSTPAVTLDFQLEDSSLALNVAIPCGLILNELVANALKHAFVDRPSGAIVIEFRRMREGEMLLAVSDDGCGLDAAFDPAQSDSLGMQLVITLVEQLDGSLVLGRQPGASFRITFPEAA